MTEETINESTQESMDNTLNDIPSIHGDYVVWAGYRGCGFLPINDILSIDVSYSSYLLDFYMANGAKIQSPSHLVGHVYFKDLSKEQYNIFEGEIRTKLDTLRQCFQKEKLRLISQVAVNK